MESPLKQLIVLTGVLIGFTVLASWRVAEEPVLGVLEATARPAQEDPAGPSVLFLGDVSARVAAEALGEVTSLITASDRVFGGVATRKVLPTRWAQLRDLGYASLLPMRAGGEDAPEGVLGVWEGPDGLTVLGTDADADLGGLIEVVEGIKEAGAAVAVMVRWEQTGWSSPDQRTWAQALAAAGVDLVVGVGGTMQEIDLFGETVVAYNLGALSGESGESHQALALRWFPGSGEVFAVPLQLDAGAPPRTLAVDEIGGVYWSMMEGVLGRDKKIKQRLRISKGTLGRQLEVHR